MRTLIVDPLTAGLDELRERRRRSGLDRLDEVWDGVVHMVLAPSFAHARIAHQLALLLDGPARAAGLIPAIGEFNLGLGEHDFPSPRVASTARVRQASGSRPRRSSSRSPRPATRRTRSCPSTPLIALTRC